MSLNLGAFSAEIFRAGFSFSSGGPEYLHLPLNSYFKFQDFIYFLIILSSVYLIGPDIHSRLFCTSSIKVRKKAYTIYDYRQFSH